MRGAAAVNEWKGQIEGPVVVKGTNEIDFTIPFSFAGSGFGADAATNGREQTSYSGSINPDGSASGIWHLGYEQDFQVHSLTSPPLLNLFLTSRSAGKPRDPNAQNPAATEETATSGPTQSTKKPPA